MKRIERRFFADINFNAGRRHDDIPIVRVKTNKVSDWLLPTFLFSLNVIHYLWVQQVI